MCCPSCQPHPPVSSKLRLLPFSLCITLPVGVIRPSPVIPAVACALPCASLLVLSLCGPVLFSCTVCLFSAIQPILVHHMPALSCSLHRMTRLSKQPNSLLGEPLKLSLSVWSQRLTHDVFLNPCRSSCVVLKVEVHPVSLTSTTRTTCWGSVLQSPTSQAWSGSSLLLQQPCPLSCYSQHQPLCLQSLIPLLLCPLHLPHPPLCSSLPHSIKLPCSLYPSPTALCSTLPPQQSPQSPAQKGPS